LIHYARVLLDIKEGDFVLSFNMCF